MQYCSTHLTLAAIWVGFAATFILAVLAVKGVKVTREGAISMNWDNPPPTDPVARARWAFPRYWLYRIGLPLGMFLFLISVVLQIAALYAPACK